MSLTSDSGACSASSSDACGRDAWEEEMVETGEEEEEYEGESDAAAAAAAAVVARPRPPPIDGGIEFVSDADIAAAAAAEAVAVGGVCGHHRHRRRQGGGRGQQAAGGAGSRGRQPATGAGRAYSHHRERVRRERFVELYGKLHTAIPALQTCKRVTHRKILTETAVYLAGTIAQIRARRRVNKLRALLAQLEADTAYMRRLSGLPQGIERQQPHQQVAVHHHGQHRVGGSSSVRKSTVSDESSSAVLTIGDCFLIG